jgi:hypothetical protein
MNKMLIAYPRPDRRGSGAEFSRDKTPVEFFGWERSGKETLHFVKLNVCLGR